MAWSRVQAGSDRKTKIANFVSWISDPLVVIPISFLIAVLVSRTSVQSLVLWLSVFLVIYTLPVGYLLLLYRQGKITGLSLSVRNQRAPLLVSTFVYSLITLWAVIKLNPPLLLVNVLIVGLVLGFFLAIFTLFWKVSLHMAVYTVTVVILASVFGTWYWLFLLLLPVIAWSRVYLGRHSVKEVVAGSVIGLLAALVIFVL